MNFFDKSYYIAGKNVTRLIGRWPYQNRWESRICSFVTIIFCSSQFIAQVIGVIVYFNDKEVVLESITPFMIAIFCTSKYINAIFNVKTMTKLLNRLKEDWDIYTSEEEKGILSEYAHIGQLVIYGYMVVVYVTTVIFITEPLIPKWINIIFHINETVPNKYPVPIYWYKIDMEANFYLILCYESICIVTILTITIANDALFIVFLQHACALFAVVQHQLQKSWSEKDLQKVWKVNGKFNTTNDIQYEHYVMCIKNHKRAIEFAKLLEDMYVWCFGVVIGINMLLISVTALQLTTQSSTIQQIIKYTMFTCALMIHLFFDCYLSQRLIDKSSNIQEYINLSEWYKMSVNTQKLVILVTLRSQKPCKLTAGKLVLLSMETFGSIMKTAASYFTVLVSMQ